MAKKVTFVAEYQGQRFTRTATTGRVYTHVTLARTADGEVFDNRWSMSAKGAQAKLPYGWEDRRVAVVECYPEGQEPKVEEAPAAPAAEVELCASNSNAKVMHYRVKGGEVSLCLKAATSRKANARQIADNNICAGCAAAHQH
jgi:hypothetical protein